MPDDDGIYIPIQIHQSMMVLWCYFSIHITVFNLGCEMRMFRMKTILSTEDGKVIYNCMSGFI
jgi:hypothetical protein